MMEGVPVPVRHAVPRLQAGDLVKWRWTNQIGVILYVKYIENDSLTKCYQGDGVMYDAYKSRELWEVVFMLNRPI